MFGEKHRHIFLRLVMVLIFCILPVVSVKAKESDSESQEGWKTVRVACNINKSLYLNEHGDAEGYCSEYLADLAKINHWNLEYVEGSWTESVQNLYDGKIDLLCPTQMTDEREGTMGFSSAIGGYQPIGLFAKSTSELCFDDFAGFDGAKIAVSAGTSNEEALQEYAKNNSFTYEPVYLNTTEDKMQALNDGTVDLIVFSTLNDVENGKVVAMLDYLPFYYCTRIDDTELLDELNTGMNQMIIRHPDVVQDVFYNFMNKNISFAYTAEEQQAITERGKIIIGVYEDTPPLFDLNKDGEPVGIYVDIIERIKENSGMDIEIKPLDRKEYAFDYLDQGAIDFIMGSSDQALLYSGAEGYVESEGVMDYYSINITRSDFSLKDTDDLKIALTTGRKYWAPILSDKYPSATFEYYESSKNCLDAVKSGKADLTILNSWEYNYQSKNQRYEDLMEWENSRTLSQTVFVSLEEKTGNDLIRSVLDKSIEQISNAEKEAMITSNLNRAYSSYTFWDHVYEMKQTLLIFVAVVLMMSACFVVYVVMRKRAVKALEEKNYQLEQANDSKDRFLSRMSHELRTPLNAIQGYATVMEQNIETQEMNEEQIHSHLDSILRAAKYQLAIIGDLLDIQKIEENKMELAPTEINFTEYMDNIVEMIHQEAVDKSIAFSYQRLTNVNEFYYMDGVRFQQVLLNILHNAIKFSDVGGKVKMTAEVVDQDEASNTIKFVISDNGIGMSEDFQQNYLFHRFAQEYKGNKSPYEGCGTGLAISREIVHLMGGEITCKSEQGVGSTFTVILTAKHLDRKKKRRERRQMPNYDLSGVRVLLCEDNQMNQDIEKRLLEKMKCEVEIADDGKIGFEKFKQSELGYYQVILMDIRMPNMDGLEATEAIRACERADAKDVKIFAVSANAFEEDVQKSLAAGMNEHLAKPVDVKVLYETIKRYARSAV